MTNGWTGGQYSLYRFVFGAYLFVHFCHLVPWAAEMFASNGLVASPADSPLYPLFPNLLFVWDTPAAAVGLCVLGVLCSAMFALGAYDRLGALGCWYVWACLFTRNPLIANPGIPYVGWLLIAHLALPVGPFGSWSARGRQDPGSLWRMPTSIYAAAWIVMAMGYTYSGVYKLLSPSWLDGSAFDYVLNNPLAREGLLRNVLTASPPVVLQAATWGALALEIGFAPLALLAALRPYLWLAMVGMHLGLIAIVDFADLTIGMLMIHAFTFDPEWIPATASGRRSTVFYDGSCGLCHRVIRFVLSEDRAGRAFDFAPLQSEAFQAAVPKKKRKTLADSVVVVLPDATVLQRAGAVLEIGRRLGGLWGLAARVVGLVPLAWLDRTYDWVAARRKRWFRTPEQACPILPTHLRERFL